MSRAMSKGRTLGRFPRRRLWAAGVCFVLGAVLLVLPQPASAVSNGGLVQPGAVFLDSTDSSILGVTLSVHNHMLHEPDRWGVQIVLTEVASDGSTRLLGVQINTVSELTLLGADGNDFTKAEVLWETLTDSVISGSTVEMCTQAVILVNGEWQPVGQEVCAGLSPIDQ